MIELSLGFSSCPNDTFIFDALVHRRIHHGYRFKVIMEDVETLNRMALNNELDITKVSIHAWFHVLSDYRLLSSGAALGKGCGPLLIGKDQKRLTTGVVALPGELTTASLLFKMAIPGDFKYLYMPFDEIIPSIIENRVDAGVIIHESRFTYQEVGLHCILDLGEWWEDETGCLIPLGGIIASNGLDRKIRLETRRLIRGSIEFAEEHPEEARGYILENAQELDEEIVDSHIGLYVNEYSKDLGDEGRRAIEQLYRRSRALGLLPETGWNGDHQFFSP